jgi:hypothetical protein
MSAWESESRFEEAKHVARRDSPAGRSSSVPASHRRVLQPGASDRDLFRAALIRALPNSTEQLRSGRAPTPPLVCNPYAAHLHPLLRRRPPARIPAGGLAKTPYWTAADLSSPASAASCSPQVRISMIEQSYMSIGC